MNRLIKAVETAANVSVTNNGAAANASALNACLDFFFVGPVAKQNPTHAVTLFQKAYHSDKELSLRVLQWVRDARGGAGARQAFRDCFAWLMDYDSKDAIAVLNNTANIGRWDDLLVALFSNKPAVADHAVALIKNGLANPETSGLVAKWMPRKGVIAAALRASLGYTPKQYRKTLVNLSNTVEQKMCANEWNGINYSHVPSVATARYRTAFERHDFAGYQSYLVSVEKGEAKINASAVFPHDVLRNMYNSTETARQAMDLQWNALPDYLEGTTDTGLCVVDVSDSMTWFKVGGSVIPRDVAIGLGMYMAERARGPFKNIIIPFSESPKLVKLTGKTVIDRYRQVMHMGVGGSTNIAAVFDLILTAAMTNKVPVEDMPASITIISDMEFNPMGYNVTAQKMIVGKYAAAGYKLPKIIYWNLQGRIGNTPATKHDIGVALISGYSPAILGTVFSCESLQPENVMLEAVMKDRYKLNY